MTTAKAEQRGLATARAAWVTAGFVALGIFGAMRSRDHLGQAWPQIGSFCLLVWNDFYSIRYFSSFLDAKKPFQMAIDCFLFLAHVFLAFNFANPLYFQVGLALLFCEATLKYSNELNSIERPERLYRKIAVDTIGTIGCVVATLGMVFGYVRIAAIAWVVLFALVSVYVVHLKPLYQDATKDLPDGH
jgi:NhaP-type Na+/H+ or K+/H+ antiporter